MELEKKIHDVLRQGGYSPAHYSKKGTANEGQVSAGYQLDVIDSGCRLSFEKGNMVFSGMPVERVNGEFLEMYHHLVEKTNDLTFKLCQYKGARAVKIKWKE